MCFVQHADVMMALRGARYPAVLEVRWYLKEAGMPSCRMQETAVDAGLSFSFEAAQGDCGAAPTDAAVIGKAQIDCGRALEAEALVIGLLALLEEPQRSTSKLCGEAVVAFTKVPSSGGNAEVVQGSPERRKATAHLDSPPRRYVTATRQEEAVYSRPPPPPHYTAAASPWSERYARRSLLLSPSSPLEAGLSATTAITTPSEWIGRRPRPAGALVPAAVAGPRACSASPAVSSSPPRPHAAAFGLGSFEAAFGSGSFEAARWGLGVPSSPVQYGSEGTRKGSMTDVTRGFASMLQATTTSPTTREGTFSGCRRDASCSTCGSEYTCDSMFCRKCGAKRQVLQASDAFAAGFSTSTTLERIENFRRQVLEKPIMQVAPSPGLPSPAAVAAAARGLPSRAAAWEAAM